MWELIRRNADRMCYVTFGRFSPRVRFILGIIYEALDYIARLAIFLASIFIPIPFISGLSNTVLDPIYFLVCALLAGGEGIKWGFGDVILTLIPIPVPFLGRVIELFLDWFPGLTIAVIRVNWGYVPEPGRYDNGYIEEQRGDVGMEERRAGAVSRTRPGCLSPHFFGALTFILLIPTGYFGINWVWSNSYDYHEKAWEIVQKNPVAYVAAGKDKGLEIKNKASEKLGPMIEKGKQAVGDILGQLGFGQEEESLSGPSPEGSKEQERVQKKEGEELNYKLKEKAEKELKFGPYMTELYAGKVTRDKAEELKRADIAYYWKWFSRFGIADLVSLVLTIGLALFGRGRGGPRNYRSRNTIGLDDDI